MKETNISQHNLFETYKTCSCAIPFDIDINFHKSNSTFFLDADISRAALFSRLFSQALVDIACLSRDLHASGEDTAKGVSYKHRLLPAASLILASTHASFLRPIAPLERYDVVSRVLSWDPTALFFVTYFINPDKEIRLSAPGEKEMEASDILGPAEIMKDATMRKALFAVLVSRYVVRLGRQKITPQDLIVAAGLEGRDGKSIDRMERARVAGMRYMTTSG